MRRDEAGLGQGCGNAGCRAGGEVAETVLLQPDARCSHRTQPIYCFASCSSGLTGLPLPLPAPFFTVLQVTAFLFYSTVQYFLFHCS